MVDESETLKRRSMLAKCCRWLVRLDRARFQAQRRGHAEEGGVGEHVRVPREFYS